MFTKDKILIGLSPSFLRIASRSGKGLERVERIPLDPAQWTETWTKGLRSLDVPLSGAMAALKVRAGSVARVVYSTPETVVDVCTVPARGAAALAAAKLALRDSLRHATERVSVTEAVACDAGATPRTHVMIAAENGAHTETLGALLARAGLRMGGLVPTKAVLIQASIAETTKLPEDGAPALIYLGDHATVLAARLKGRIEFVRVIDLGYGQLAESIVRAAASLGRPLDRVQAYRLLFTVGVPRRGQVIEPSIGLRAEAVLPMMQSVLQRFMVETRQSLRFGVPEADLARASIHLTGPGCDIPGLGELFASELDWPVTRRDPEVVNGVPLGGVGNDEFGELLEVTHTPQAVVMHPPSMTARREQRTIRRALVGGAAAAILAAVGGWFTTRQTLKAIEGEFAALSTRTAAIEERRSLREQAVHLSGELTGALRHARSVTGDRPGWAATMAAVSHLTGDGIEVSEMQGSYAKEPTTPPTLTMRGLARTSGGPDSDPLGEFVNRLSRCPMIESARVLSTRSERANGAEVRQFVVEAQLRTLPVITAAAALKETP